jgi:hypothetical protein
MKTTGTKSDFETNDAIGYTQTRDVSTGRQPRYAEASKIWQNRQTVPEARRGKDTLVYTEPVDKVFIHDRSFQAFWALWPKRMGLFLVHLFWRPSERPAWAAHWRAWKGIQPMGRLFARRQRWGISLATGFSLLQNVSLENGRYHHKKRGMQ